MKYLAEVICDKKDIINKFEVEDVDIVSATKKANNIFTNYINKNKIRVGKYKLKVSKVI